MGMWVWKEIWVWDFGQNKGFIKALIFTMLIIRYLLPHSSPLNLAHVADIYTPPAVSLHRLECGDVGVERDLGMGLWSK